MHTLHNFSSWYSVFNEYSQIVILFYSTVFGSISLLKVYNTISEEHKQFLLCNLWAKWIFGGWFFRNFSFWFYIVYNSLKIHILRNELWWEILLRISKATDHWLFEVSSNFIIYNSARECICYFYCLKMYIIISRISLM